MPAARPLLLVLVVSLVGGCGKSSSPSSSASTATDSSSSPQSSSQALAEKYTTVRLDADVNGLSDDQKEMVRLFIEAAQSMDGIFWEQAYGNRDSLLQTIRDPQVRRFVNINYGPWDRLNDNEPFIEGVGPKPPGANFYPDDMTKAEFERAVQSDDTLDDLYTMVRRLPDGSLTALPYHRFFAGPMETVASRLREAAALAENERFKRYLELRGEALTTGDYGPSDRAWMDLETNELDLIIGPIETHEDRLFGHKASATTVVLRRDRDWSQRLRRYAEQGPTLQEDLPIPEKYGSVFSDRPAEMRACDVLYLAGEANAGPTPTILTLPNDEVVREETGARHILLMNAMRAMVDEVFRPTASVLITGDQRSHVTEDAFAVNTVLEEKARDLVASNTSADGGSMRKAATDLQATMETARAEVLGLALATKISDEEARNGNRMENYTAFLLNLFRSLRIGGDDARADLLQFNYLRDRGAVSRDSETGTYAVKADTMEQAVADLARELLRVQNDGNAEGAASFIEKYSTMPRQLRADLDRLGQEGIPVDITYEQEPSMLNGLEAATATK